MAIYKTDQGHVLNCAYCPNKAEMDKKDPTMGHWTCPECVKKLDKQWD